MQREHDIWVASLGVGIQALILEMSFNTLALYEGKLIEKVYNEAQQSQT